jgi:A/G-specific adenine glycosylase
MPTLIDQIIGWYDQHARDLPWRRPGTSAWGVLVSEVMLQQTPVTRVEPVFRAWLARWPRPADLAAENAGEAIRAWGRLGYPRRALRLHQCATMLTQHHDGQVPAGVDELLRLPGVGDYTARAVAAFAFGQRQPVVDVNVRRLIARAVAGEPDGGSATSRRDREAAEALLPRQAARAARASAALMELGALVCTARAPACTRCPIQATCRAHTTGETAPSPRRGQGYLGTDRQVRGLLLALARGTAGPITRAEVEAVWADPGQRDRALGSLLADGLLVEAGLGRYALP